MPYRVINTFIIRVRMKEPPATPPAADGFCYAASACGARPAETLLESVRDARKGRRELRAQQLHRRDDHDRDGRGNQAILDGRRTGFVLHKTSNETGH